MAGKFCYGDATFHQYNPKLATAYCTGRGAAVAGLILGDNPHTAGVDESTSWIAGFNSWSADPATAATRDCCADAFGGGFVPE